MAHVPFTSLLLKHCIYSETSLVFSLAPHCFLNPEGFCCWFGILFFFLLAAAVFVFQDDCSSVWEVWDFFPSSLPTFNPFIHLCPSFLTLLSPKCCTALISQLLLHKTWAGRADLLSHCTTKVPYNQPPASQCDGAQLWAVYPCCIP